MIQALLVGLSVLLSGALAAQIPDKLTTDTVRVLVADPTFKDYQGLTDAIAHSPERDLKIWAYQHIAEQGKIEAFDPYLVAYKTEGNLLVKSVLLSSLGHFGTMTRRIPDWKGVGSPFVPLLDPSRQAQLLALIKEEAQPDKPEILRLAAIRRMGELRTGDTAEFLAVATKDPSPRISRAALGSIRFMGRTDFWLKQLRAGTPELRRMAVDALGGQDDPAIDKPLEEAANGSDADLAAAAHTQLEIRAKRREIQEKMERALHPSVATIVLSNIVNTAFSRGWYAVAVLIVPCLVAALWALKNKEFQTFVAAAYFIAALLIGWLAAKGKSPFQLGTQLLVALVGSALLTLPVIAQLFRRASRTLIFDSLMLLGFVLMGSVWVFRPAAMPLFLWSGALFGLTILYGVVQATINLSKGQAAEAAHCVAYASVLALLLGCMPYAFIDMEWNNKTGLRSEGRWNRKDENLWLNASPLSDAGDCLS